MLEFTVPDMSCGHCVATITRTVRQLDPQARVETDLATHQVRVETQLPAAQLREALADEGYPPA
jgi:copper chaperone